MPHILGISPCPNDTFIFDAMVHGKIDCGNHQFDLRFDDVQALNEQALEATLDIAKVSFHTMLKITDTYWLLRAGSALGRGCGPLLIAREPLSELGECSVALPGKWTTAHLLFRLAYPDVKRKEFMLFSDIEEAVLDGRVDAGVIIHENRFTYRDKGLVAIRDLGEFWEQETGAPIPLGGIAVRKDIGRTGAREIEECIRKSVEFAYDHPDSSREFVRAHAQEMDEEICRKHIDTYVTRWSRWLGEEGKASVSSLFRRAEELNIIESPPQDLYP